ncbi:transposase [Enhydrobacter sp.]|jgi:putative transposase|uniref:transposase n=1 Tax=Enhydrobacter sp. TaxID=1894999 RepID=UPI00263268CD|nr:transposase [Enhydrobacter sp.]WIM12983.1 MAG: hypothetical protein OJF58_003947 [Enhydrobacter sp.]
MKRKQLSDEQIIEILRLRQAGAKPADLYRQHGISEATLYNGGRAVWRNAGAKCQTPVMPKGGEPQAEVAGRGPLEKDIASGKFCGLQCGAARWTSRDGPRIEPAPGLQADQDGREQLPVPIAAARQRAFA